MSVRKYFNGRQQGRDYSPQTVGVNGILRNNVLFEFSSLCNLCLGPEAACLA